MTLRLLNAERINDAQLYRLGFRSVPSFFILLIRFREESDKNLVSRLQFPASCNPPPLPPQSSPSHMYMHTYIRTLRGLHSKERWPQGGSIALLGCVTITARSVVRTQRENVAGGNDEEAAELHVHLMVRRVLIND